MNWLEGYSATYYMTVLDPTSWRDVSQVDITGGNITKTMDSLMESADIELTDNLGEQWVRIYVDARQNDDGGREAIFTGLLQTPGVDWDGRRKSYSAECYSVLKASDDILLPRGWYVLSGTNGAKAAANLLAAGAAPVSYEEGAPNLYSTLVAEDGETRLSMAWKIVNAIGWRVRIDGYGNVFICPQASDPVETLDTQNVDVVEPKISDTQDLYGCPNVLRVTSGNLTTVVRDEDSIGQRGREIWADERDSALNTGESITAYAARRLKKLQSPSRSVQYNRRFLPDITPGEIIRLNLPEQGINGIYLIKKQKITLGYNATVSEEVEEI